MGTRIYTIGDKQARCGEEFPRKPPKRRQLHLVLSASGASQLCDAFSVAMDRERPSQLVIRCHGQVGRVGRVVWYQQLIVIVPGSSGSQPFDFVVSDDSAQLIIDRQNADVFRELTIAMKDGQYDVAFPLGKSITLWAWGNGLGP